MNEVANLTHRWRYNVVTETFLFKKIFLNKSERDMCVLLFHCVLLKLYFSLLNKYKIAN